MGSRIVLEVREIRIDHFSKFLHGTFHIDGNVLEQLAWAVSLGDLFYG